MLELQNCLYRDIFIALDRYNQNEIKPIGIQALRNLGHNENATCNYTITLDCGAEIASAAQHRQFARYLPDSVKVQKQEVVS